jgi:hypothetical protein
MVSHSTMIQQSLVCVHIIYFNFKDIMLRIERLKNLFKLGIDEATIFYKIGTNLIRIKMLRYILKIIVLQD